MERSQVLDAMSQLKLYGMKAAYDETIATAVKRQHEPQQIIGDLLNAEISEKQARSIKYQMTIAKLPLAKEVDEFSFEGTPVNEALVRDLATGEFLAQQRNVVLIGGTGTGKSHLAVSIARACIRRGRRGRFFNVVDLVNKLDAEARADKILNAPEAKGREALAGKLAVKVAGGKLTPAEALDMLKTSPKGESDFRKSASAYTPKGAKPGSGAGSGAPKGSGADALLSQAHKSLSAFRN